MKILFLVYHALAEYSGISKKILAQVEGLRACGAEVTLCTLHFPGDGTQRRVCNGEPIRTFGSGIRAKIVKRVSYSDILDYVAENGIDAVYIRYDINSDPFTAAMAKKLHRRGVKVIVEIPTWPYDGEFKGQSAKLKVQLYVDKMFRRSFFKHCDRVVTYAGCREIFGRPAINISNGVDFGKVQLTAKPFAGEELHMLSVANIHLWHGLDRLIAGMALHKDVPAVLHIVGDGLPEIIEGYRKQAEDAGISDRVCILGPLYGERLDGEFAWANVAVGSLGRHRSGITDIKTLKNREYAARGFLFFYSENDTDFDEAPYVLKVPADESPVDIGAIREFVEAQKMTPEEIRESIRSLSWQAQMNKVITEAGLS